MAFIALAEVWKFLVALGALKPTLEIMLTLLKIIR